MAEAAKKRSKKDGAHGTKTSQPKIKLSKEKAISKTDVNNSTGRRIEREMNFEIVVSTKVNGNQVKKLESAFRELNLPATPSVETILYDVLDTRELFGNSPYPNKVDLRTADQLEQGSAIKLPQFDPNFFSPDRIHCRYAGCRETKPRSSKELNEDLYLCPSHRQEMVDLVVKKCSEKKITVNFEDFKNEDFNGYTSVIGPMEKAFQHFKEKASKEKASPTHASSVQVDGLLAEICLNTRNFFMITNALLNPDEDNVRSSLFSVITLLESLLNKCNNREFVDNICRLLREVMQIILQSFGIVYTWVCQTFPVNPYGRIGVGLGMAVGAIAGAMFYRRTLTPIILSAVIGSVSGGLIGTGIFNLNRNYQGRDYRFEGDFPGNLNMSILWKR